MTVAWICIDKMVLSSLEQDRESGSATFREGKGSEQFMLALTGGIYCEIC
jgi:hypothetical protein